MGYENSGMPDQPDDPDYAKIRDMFAQAYADREGMTVAGGEKFFDRTMSEHDARLSVELARILADMFTNDPACRGEAEKTALLHVKGGPARYWTSIEGEPMTLVGVPLGFTVIVRRRERGYSAEITVPFDRADMVHAKLGGETYETRFPDRTVFKRWFRDCESARMWADRSVRNILND